MQQPFCTSHIADRHRLARFAHTLLLPLEPASTCIPGLAIDDAAIQRIEAALQGAAKSVSKLGDSVAPWCAFHTCKHAQPTLPTRTPRCAPSPCSQLHSLALVQSSLPACTLLCLFLPPFPPPPPNPNHRKISKNKKAAQKAATELESQRSTLVTLLNSTLELCKVGVVRGTLMQGAHAGGLLQTCASSSASVASSASVHTCCCDL